MTSLFAAAVVDPGTLAIFASPARPIEAAPKKRKGTKLPNFLRESEADQLLETCRALIKTAPPPRRADRGEGPGGLQRQQAKEAHAALMPIVHALNAEGLSLVKIADRLNAEGHTTREGKKWQPNQVARVLYLSTGRQPPSVRAARADEVIVHLGLFMGLRVSEMINLDIEHLDFEERRCLILQGKGGKDRYICIPAEMIDLLKAWIGERRTGPLLLTNQRTRFLYVKISWRMARLGRLAGLQRKLRCHTLRHSFAVRLIEKGAGIHEVRDLLGHASISNTDIYLTCTPERLRAAVDRLFVKDAPAPQATPTADLQQLVATLITRLAEAEAKLAARANVE